jgi:two-component system sensor histidine kinase UhpB
LAVVFAVALVLGQRVEREWVARRRAETASAALRASNTRYRGLLESSPAAIMVLDAEGDILEANTAAGVLFSRDQAVLESMSLQDLLGDDGAEQVLSMSRGDGDVPRALNLRMDGSVELYIEPTLTEVADGRGDVVVQVVFRDATEERDRQSGLRAYAAHMIRAQEEERQRIARELHDETIQLLVLLHRRLDSLISTGGLPSRGFAENVQEARDSADELVRRLRDFATSLRPSTLDDLGMVTSIRRAATDLAERNDVDARVNVVGEERRLPPHAELGLFRIAQEALWNVEHHARAGRLEVTITFGANSTTLRVVDNGVGFRVPAGSDFAASGQLGLISMQERAGLLGGKVTITSRPGKGTAVDASIPFAGTAPEFPNRGVDG